MKKIKKTITPFLYSFVLFLVKLHPTKRKNGRRLLLIKNDEIGDYILFRNFLKDFRNSEKYQGEKIVLLGNIIWKQLFDEFDKDLVDEVLWVNKTKFKQDLFYRFGFLLQIRKADFSTVINCVYSRNQLTDDCFVSVINCNQKIGFANEVWRSYTKVKNTNSLYNELIKVDEGILFEMTRNREFFARVLEKQEGELHSSVFIEPVNRPVSKERYCVVFAGAGKQDKLWPTKYFAEVIQYIGKVHKLPVYLCGGPGDVKDSNAVKELIDVSGDYTGKLTMVESLAVLKGASFMLSVDTGAVHMGAGVNCPVIALYSGRDYGRFAPYPKEIFEAFYSVFSDKVDAVIKDNYGLLQDPTLFQFSEIKNIVPEKVYPYIDLVARKLFR